MQFESAAPKVQIILADGKSRGLRYYFRDLHNIREKYGLDFNDQKTFSNATQSILPDLIHIGLRSGAGEGETLSADDLLDYMDAEQTNEYFAAVVRAGNGSDIMEWVVSLKKPKAVPMMRKSLEAATDPA